MNIILEYVFKFTNWVLSEPVIAVVVALSLILSRKLAKIIGFVILAVIVLSYINIALPIKIGGSSSYSDILSRMDSIYDTVEIDYKNVVLPLKNFSQYPITTKFGVIDRVHPYRHQGIDIGLPVGTPVIAMEDGIVVSTGYDRGRGNYIMIYHPKLKFLCIYYHLASFTNKKKVKRGEIVGRTGNSGRSTAPHLHWQIEMSDKNRIKAEKKYNIIIKHMGTHIDPSIIPKEFINKDRV